ncbi:MAG: 16S rRNA (adenine(1518)-N(6)/adenine(1519)-N(6))-dimethyltransferase RsmA [Actinobacteria bacterium]|nr:16S rRNA (adenine(1518)-N(6)/adenine(1519)-N(6))-dimethyltransferase RsmA [Actinomycetota bacterium]
MAGGLGAAAVRDLAARHGIRPSKALGQHFLIDPNLARAIATDAGVGPEDRVVEVGAGLGSLTVALSATGARVLAIEFDRALLPALREAVKGRPGVRVLGADASKLDWRETLGPGSWTMCANLPYNIAVPLVQRVLAEAPGVRRLAVMVQREVAERFVARPGEEGYGPVSVLVAYHTEASLLRRVPPEVFWPRPKVGSAVVLLERRTRPAVEVDPIRLRRVVDAGFAGRRKTMRVALRSLSEDPERVLRAAGVDPAARAEQLSLAAFARIAGEVPS